MENTNEKIAKSLEYQIDLLMDEKRELEREIDIYEEDYMGEEEDRIIVINKQLENLHKQYDKVSIN